VVIAAVLYDATGRLTAALGGRRTIASALMTLAVLLLIVAPFGALVTFVTRESAIGLAYLRETLGVSSVSELRGAILPVPLQRILDVLHLSQEQVFDAASKLVEIVQGAAPEIVASGSRAVLATVIMLIALHFLLRDGERVAQWAARVSPLEARQTQELTAEMRRVTRATVIGILATAVFQGVCAGAGYLFAGIPHPAFFGLLTAMVSFVPGVGTSLVWGPAAVSLWVGGAARRGRRAGALLLRGRGRRGAGGQAAAHARPGADAHRAHLPLPARRPGDVGSSASCSAP